MADSQLSDTPSSELMDESSPPSQVSILGALPSSPAQEDCALSPLSRLCEETLDFDDDDRDFPPPATEEEAETTEEGEPSPSSPFQAYSEAQYFSAAPLRPTPWGSYMAKDWAAPSVPWTPHLSQLASKPSSVGAGLANLGNTCFMNAILQCFTHTVPLLEGLRYCSHRSPCDRHVRGFCVLCALREHIDCSLASSDAAISPWGFVDNMSCISSFFQRYQQEDAHEFLQCFLDKLDSCFLDSQPSHDDNLVKQVFGGRLISKLRCCNCNRCSDSYESIIDLSLEIKDVDTLPCALKSFTAVENIGGSETKFTCENCREEVLAEKQFLLDQAPSVAAFHLKRFKNDGNFVEKIEKHVAYPLELDLQPYTIGNHTSVELKYDLYAVVVHVGNSSHSGHYFCFVRSSQETWHRLDDSKVTRVQEDFVLSQEAYILFYARHGTPWFSAVMEAQTECKASNGSSTSPKSVLENLDGVTALALDVDNVNSTRHQVGDRAEGIAAASSKPTLGSEIRLLRPLGSPSNFSVPDIVRGRTDENPMSSSIPVHENNSVQEDVDVNHASGYDTGPAFTEGSHSCRKTSPSSAFGKVYRRRSGVSRQSLCSDSSSKEPETSYSVKKKIDLSLLWKDKKHSDVSGHPSESRCLTPPRSPTPDIYENAPKDVRHHAPQDNQGSCKRTPHDASMDLQYKAACRVLKTLPSDRSSKLMAAMLGSRSEGFLSKKRKRSELPHSHARRKSYPGPVMNPLAARLFQ